MNRIASSIPAFRVKVPVLAFLLACVLAGANLWPAAKTAPAERVEELDTESAARLLIHVAKPAYPPIARVNFVRGSVKLQIRVTPEGRVAEAHVLDGEPILAVAALNAVRKWLYRPYHSPEGPAPFLTYVSVRFNLHPRRFRGQLPKDADNYLEKQIKLPEIISHPRQDLSSTTIMMKVLVGAKGEVLDAMSTEARKPEADLARDNLRHWRFRPARWGAIAVPWYLMVRVPVDRVSLNELANSAKR